MDINDQDHDPLLECLLVLSSYHGRPTTKEALLSGLPVEAQLTPGLFARASGRVGLISKIVNKSLDKLNPALLPAVLLLNNNEVCLLMGWGPDRRQAKVVYPELSEAVVDEPVDQLLARYSGSAILVRPRFRFDARAPEVKGSREAHWFWGAIRENIPTYRDVLIAAFLINMFALALPLFTMNVYDRVVPNHAIETLWMLAVGVSLVMVVDLILRTMRGYFLDLASKRIDIKLSALIMEKVLGLRMEVRPLSAGSFASNLRAFETVRDFIASASVTALIDLPFVLIFVAVIFWIGPLILVPILVGILIVLLYAWLTQSRLQELTEATFRASAMRNATLIESLVGLETIKGMGAEGLMQRRWEKTAAFLAATGVKLRLLSSTNVNVTQWVQQLVSVAVIIVGVYLIANGQLTMGGLIASTMLSGRIMAPLAQIAGLMTQYHNAATALTSLEEVMARPVERPGDANFLSRPKFRGDIEFRNVSFAYPDAGVGALQNVSFKIKAGEHVAVMGRIGSGKSTLQKLAIGFYQPIEGSVLIDGVDLRQLDPAELRQQVGFVPQEATLFYGTLRENLVLGHPQADDEAVLQAAEFANLNEFVNQHPQGFDMMVGERGESLSGGQRKSIALARAVIHNPPIMLLDEPTGSMDHSTEVWVKRKLAEFSKGKTMLMVTHRTSLLDMADRIIVVDGGKIVADGPREQVIEALRSGRVGRAS